MDPDGGADAADAWAADAGPDAACLPEDLRYAPPPRQLGGGWVVPIDVESLEATVVLDPLQETAQAQAWLRFRVGPVGGRVFFDLRQEIRAAALDGAAVSPGLMAHRDFGAEIGAELRVLEPELDPCTEHVLWLDYDLERPAAAEALEIEWVPDATAVRWDFWFSDLQPGRYLEQWLPANLIYDRFATRLEIRLTSDTPHTLITNGDASALSAHRWLIEFPETSTSLSPLVVLRPAADLVTEAGPIELPGGRTVQLELHRLCWVAESLPDLWERIVTAMTTFTQSTGPYLQAGRMTVLVWDDETRSMEYDGAATTLPDALEHELFHSFYGRCLKPARGADGWLDEAWNVYNTGVDDPLGSRLLPQGTPPVMLCSDNPWSRTTPRESYDHGNAFFAHLAALMGREALRGAMSDFYLLHAPGVVSTRDLEAHLYCLDRDEAVLQAFHRFVYGRPGTADPDDAPLCEQDLRY